MDTMCEICGRVSWGHWVTLGHGRWRHAECEPGSRPWIEKMRNVTRTSEQELLFQFYTKGTII